MSTSVANFRTFISNSVVNRMFLLLFCNRFDSVTHQLSTIPLLSCLSAFTVGDAKSLLEWINAQVGNKYEVNINEVLFGVCTEVLGIFGTCREVLGIRLV